MAQSTNLESIAREMFPAEYEAITDDNPLPEDKQRAVLAEQIRRRGRQIMTDRAVEMFRDAEHARVLAEHKQRALEIHLCSYAVDLNDYVGRTERSRLL
jgi:hypothetical protein